METSGNANRRYLVQPRSLAGMGIEKKDGRNGMSEGEKRGGRCGVGVVMAWGWEWGGVGRE